MGVEIFHPKIVPQDKYGVAVKCEGGMNMLIETYSTLNRLKEGYREWFSWALERGYTLPRPVEIVGGLQHKRGKVRILTDIIKEEGLTQLS